MTMILQLQPNWKMKSTTLFCYRCCCYVVVIIYHLALHVHGFSGGGGGVQLVLPCISRAHKRRNRRQQHLHLSVAVVAPPEIAIDTNTLLYQAYTALTVKEIKDILRQYGAKITGNKSELIDRLGDILNGRDNYEEDEQHPRYVAKVKQKTLKEYNEMTLNELRELLRERGFDSEGNKRELVHRILISGYEAKPQLFSVVRDNNLELAAEPDDNRKWQVLEPSIQCCQYLTNDEMTDTILGDGTELPFLSGLLFVNKPSGWSTLPTKQQLDNPSCPSYPCLSDSVIEWLKTDPDGKQRHIQAQLDEQRYWDGVLRTEPRNSKQKREMKKRIRQYEKQLEKVTLFEPRPAHRLDIDTSGIVCVALTPTALRNANMLFEKKSRSGIEGELVVSDMKEGGVEKRYLALVEGSMDKDSSAGAICHAIGKVWVDDHNEWACDVHDDGSFAFIRQNGSSDTTFVPETLREATTSYKAVDWGTIRTNNGDSKSVTRVELTPHTGRGHQLRLHMASINHPIVGDDMHGDRRTIDKHLQLCLHASKLSMDLFCFGSNDGDNASVQNCRVVVESAPPFFLSIPFNTDVAT